MTSIHLQVQIFKIILVFFLPVPLILRHLPVYNHGKRYSLRTDRNTYSLLTQYVSTLLYPPFHASEKAWRAHDRCRTPQKPWPSCPHPLTSNREVWPLFLLPKQAPSVFHQKKWQTSRFEVRG